MKLRALFLFVALVLLLPSAALAQTPKPTCFLSVSSSAVEVGKTVNLTWSSQNATRGNITSIGAVGTNGIQGVIPTAPATTYIGTFVGPGGIGTCSVKVSIIQGIGGGGSDGSPGTVAEPPKLDTAPTLALAPTLPAGQDIKLSGKTSTGIVPCGGPGDPTGCQACHLAQLGQGIINFLVGLSIPLAAALFAYAGFIYFTSSVLDKIEKAKKIFTSVLIGFAIVVGGWLVVQTILKTILNENYYKSWNKIECVKSGARNTTATIDQLIGSISILNKLNTSGQPVVVDTSVQGILPNGAPSGYVGCDPEYSLQGTNCVHPDSGDTYVAKPYGNSFLERYSAVGNSGAGTQQWASALAEACSRSGLSDCALAQAIMANESSGRATAVSPVGAGGLMQIMPATARGLDPDRLSGLSDAEVRSVLVNDPSYNMQLGTKELARLYDKYQGDVVLVAAAYNGGDKANKCGSDCQRLCGGGTAWQCTAFPGYAETRVYTQKVASTYNLLR